MYLFENLFGSLFRRFEDIMKINLLKSSKMKLIVANLGEDNVKLITKLSNIISVEGISQKTNLTQLELNLSL